MEKEKNAEDKNQSDKDQTYKPFSFFPKGILEKVRSKGQTDKSKEQTDKTQVPHQKIKNKIEPSRKLTSQKISTGIPGLDNLTEGGFENKSINLVAGGSGSGKSIFALQFLIECVKKGDKVLYITFEEKKEEVYENMKKIGWDLDKLEKSGNFFFLEYSPEKVKMMLDEGGGAIESMVIKHKIKRMAIDSITSFSVLFDDDSSKRHAIIGLCDIIRKWKCTTLLTVQHDPLDKKEKGMLALEFEADGIILLYYSKIKNKRERFIEILKMRGTNHSKEVHKFEIDKGIKIIERVYEI